MLTINQLYRLENIADKLTVSQLTYQIKRDTLLEGIHLKIPGLRYLLIIFAYAIPAFWLASDVLGTIVYSLFRLIKAVFGLPMYLLGGSHRHESWKSRAFIRLVILSPIILVIGYFFGMYIFLAGPIDKQNQQFLLSLHQYRIAVSVRDKTRNLLGIMPNSVARPSQYIDMRYDKGEEEGLFQKAYNRESSLYVDITPDFFWEVLKQREHPQLRFIDEPGLKGFIKGIMNKSYRGVDVSAPLRKLTSKLTFKSKGGGGSTPMNSMIKKLYGDFYFNQRKNRKHECPIIINLFSMPCRKWVEYRAARDLFPYLALNNGKEFKRWVAMHAPFVGGLDNSGLFGLQAASAIMFGKKPEDLTRAEQSFIAASYLTDFRFSYFDVPVIHSEEEWKEVCKRGSKNINRKERWTCRKRAAKVFAIRVLKKQYKGDALLRELASLDREFIALDRPKAPKIPSVLRPYFDADPRAVKVKNRLYADLRSRLNLFMPGFAILTETELEEFIHKYPTAYPVELVTTLSLKADYDFRKSLGLRFKKLEQRYPFNIRLTMQKSSKEGQAIKKQASIRVAVAELQTGNILRYYLQEDPSTAVEEKKNRLRPNRPIASIGKIAATMLLIKKGLRADTLLCNEYHDGLRNAGGDTGVKDCSKRYTLEETIAQSKNLPLQYALNNVAQVSLAELHQLYSDFGLIPSRKPKGKSIRQHMIDNLSFGAVQSTAANTHRIINMVAHLLVDKGRNQSRVLHAIKKIEHVVYDDQLQAARKIRRTGRNKSKLSSISHYLQSSHQFKNMQIILSAPVNNPRGTLHFLKNLKRGKVLFGKTGTFDTNSGYIKDKYAVGVVKVKGKLYTFSILVGSEDFNGKGLIKKIRTRQLIKPIIKEIVDSLYYAL